MFRVILEREAKENIRSLYRDLQTRESGSSYPVRWLEEIHAAIVGLADSAERSGLAYEDRFFAETIPQRLHGSFKILFAIRGDRVHVLHVRH